MVRAMQKTGNSMIQMWVRLTAISAFGVEKDEEEEALSLARIRLVYVNMDK
jgi:hypothetical protein